MSTAPMYYLTIANDTLQVTKLYILNVSQSFRFFELNALIATALLVFLTLLSFTARIHIPLMSLLDYFLHIGKISIIKKQQGEKIKGKIYDQETGDNILGSVVFLIQKIGALLFETLLVLSLMFEISLGYALGFEKTVVFLIISVINITLWLIHLIHVHSEKNFF